VTAINGKANREIWAPNIDRVRETHRIRYFFSWKREEGMRDEGRIRNRKKTRWLMQADQAVAMA
jgi:hypothetical protein